MMNQRVVTALSFFESEGEDRVFLPLCQIGSKLNALRGEYGWTRQTRLAANHVRGDEDCFCITSCADCYIGQEALTALAVEAVQHGVMWSHVSALSRLFKGSGPARKLLYGCEIGDGISHLLRAHKGRAYLADLAMEIAGDYQCTSRQSCLSCPKGVETFHDLLMDLCMHGTDGEAGEVLKRSGSLLTL